MSVVLTTLLHSSETCVTYRRHIRLLERFNQRCLRNIRWSDFVANIEILIQAEIPCIEAMPLKYRLRWARHVSRMANHRLPKTTLYGIHGHRDRGARKIATKTVLRSPSPHVILTTHGGQSWQRTVMPGAIRS